MRGFVHRGGVERPSRGIAAADELDFLTLVERDIRDVARAAVNLIDLVRRIAEHHGGVPLRVDRVLRIPDVLVRSGVQEGAAAAHTRKAWAGILGVLLLDEFFKVFERPLDTVLCRTLVFELHFEVGNLRCEGIHRRLGIIAVRLRLVVLEVGELLLEVGNLFREFRGVTGLLLFVELFENLALLFDLRVDIIVRSCAGEVRCGNRERKHKCCGQFLPARFCGHTSYPLFSELIRITFAHCQPRWRWHLHWYWKPAHSRCCFSRSRWRWKRLSPN